MSVAPETDINSGEMRAVRIAYLINQYPQPSQSFIRREILGLEAMGHAVQRHTIRRFDGNLPDPTDQAERDRTRAILKNGIGGLFLAMTLRGILWPAAFGKALAATLRDGWHSDRGVLRQVVCLAEACVLARWLKEDKIEHLHAHFGTNSATVAMLAGILAKVPYSFTAHGPEEFDRAPGLGLRSKIGRAKAVIAISEFGRGQLMRWTNQADWHKIRVVHCGLDAQFLSQMPTPPPDNRRVLCVGRLVEQKAQLILVEAAALLKGRNIPIEIRLIGDGEMRSVIEQAIAREGLHDSVLLLGTCSAEQVRDEMQAARIVAQPSLAEGLPVAIMEAFALARPVVTTQIAGIPELVDSSCGWIVPPGSAARLADALSEALNCSTSELAAKGVVGRSRVKERHDIQKEVSKLASILAER